GTRLVVRPGYYRESLALTQPVEIVGDGNPAEIILAGERGSCLRMQTTEALVRGLTIAYRSELADQRFAAIDVPRGRLIVEDCDVFGNGRAGIAVAHGGRPLIRRTQIHSGKEAGILFHDHGQGTVEDCDLFANAAAGVVIRDRSTPTLRRCRIHDHPSHYGVH